MTDLEFNQLRNADLLPAFKAKIAEPAEGVGPALQITTNMTKVLEQGIYTLLLNVVGKDNTTQPLELKLTRVAAKLRAPAPLIIEQVQPLVLGDSSVPQEFFLKEVSGRSRLSQVNIASRSGDSKRSTN